MSKQIIPFFQITFEKMISLGSFTIKDATNIVEGVWWYEITFLFVKISWGRITKPE